MSASGLHARWVRGLAIDGSLLADRLELDRRRLFLMPPRFLPDRRERVVGDLEGPLDVFLRVLRAHERALAGVRDAEEDVVPEAMDEPVPPSPGVRAQRVPEVPDLVFRREVDVADRPDVFDPGWDASVVREVLEAAVELAAEAVDVVVVLGMFSEDLESLEARGDADRMTVVRPRVERGVLPAAARLEDIHDLGFAAEARQLEAAARDFAEGRHIGPDVVVLLGAAIREAEAREHLVEDQDDALLARELAEALEVIGLRHDHAGPAEDGLDDQRADLVLVLFEDRGRGLDVVVWEDHDHVGDGLGDPA